MLCIIKQNLLMLSLPGVNLNGSILLVFIICLLAVIVFEFVNGFHDTANAVATVIYTRALKAVIAIPWSGFWNFLGVNVGGVAVAMGILKLIPLNELMALPVQVGACMVMSVLVASIIWNLGTWYLGIPCSSSHTLIGAMIGSGLAFSFYYGGVGVNWSKAEDIGLSLIISPLFGFGVAWLLMYLLKYVFKSEKLFHIPKGKNDKPSFYVRLTLIISCTLVSFFHGSNDGQKGVGLLMMVLIVFLPATFAIDHNIPNDKILESLTTTQQVIGRTLLANPSHPDVEVLNNLIAKTREDIITKNIDGTTETLKFRKNIQSIAKSIKVISANKTIIISKADKATLKDKSKDLTHITDFAPVWVILIISISLGLGTMIGWKRIVRTIGEKIGNKHLNYAQGASAAIVAAGTIGLSTGFGLPVSTTHVLSSGVAGSMVASGGTKNLNSGTLKNIGLAWILTLPVSIVLAILLFMLFHLFV